MRISLINSFVFREKNHKDVPFSATLNALHEETDAGDILTISDQKMLISPNLVDIEDSDGEEQ